MAPPQEPVAVCELYWDQQVTCRVLLPSQQVEGLPGGIAQLLHGPSPKLSLHPSRLELASLPCSLVPSGSLRCPDNPTNKDSARMHRFADFLGGVNPKGIPKAAMSSIPLSGGDKKLNYTIYILPPRASVPPIGQECRASLIELECSVAISPCTSGPQRQPQAGHVPASTAPSIAGRRMVVHPSYLNTNCQEHKKYVLGGKSIPMAGVHELPCVAEYYSQNSYNQQHKNLCTLSNLLMIFDMNAIRCMMSFQHYRDW